LLKLRKLVDHSVVLAVLLLAEEFRLGVADSNGERADSEWTLRSPVDEISQVDLDQSSEGADDRRGRVGVAHVVQND